MILHIHSNGSYLSAPRASSCAGGIHFLSDAPPPNTNFTTYNPPLIRFIYIVCKIIKVITSSAAETEFGTVFINAKEAVPIRTALEETRWPQLPTPVQVDSTTADGIANRQLKQ